MSESDIDKNILIPIIQHEQKVSILNANINALKEEIAGYVKYRKSREAELDQLRKENDRKNLYINKAIHYLKRKNIYEVQFWLNHALNAEQGGE